MRPGHGGRPVSSHSGSAVGTCDPTYHSCLSRQQLEQYIPTQPAQWMCSWCCCSASDSEGPLSGGWGRRQVNSWDLQQHYRPFWPACAEASPMPMMKVPSCREFQRVRLTRAVLASPKVRVREPSGLVLGVLQEGMKGQFHPMQSGRCSSLVRHLLKSYHHLPSTTPGEFLGYTAALQAILACVCRSFANANDKGSFLQGFPKDPIDTSSTGQPKSACESPLDWS